MKYEKLGQDVVVRLPQGEVFGRVVGVSHTPIPFAGVGYIVLLDQDITDEYGNTLEAISVPEIMLY